MRARSPAWHSRHFSVSLASVGSRQKSLQSQAFLPFHAAAIPHWRQFSQSFSIWVALACKDLTGKLSDVCRPILLELLENLTYCQQKSWRRQDQSFPVHHCTSNYYNHINVHDSTPLLKTQKYMHSFAPNNIILRNRSVSFNFGYREIYVFMSQKMKKYDDFLNFVIF